MRVCGLNSSVVYFDVKTCDIWEVSVMTRSETQTESICFLGFRGVWEGVILRRLILRSVECVCKHVSEWA